MHAGLPLQRCPGWTLSGNTSHMTTKRTVSTAQAATMKTKKKAKSKTSKPVQSSLHQIISTLKLGELHILQAYAIVSPERPARSKMMSWVNKVRRQQGERGLNNEEVRDAIEFLVKLGLMLPAVNGKGLVAQGPGAYLGTITVLCQQAIESEFAFAFLEIAEAEVSRYSISAPHGYGGYGSVMSRIHLLEGKIRLEVLAGQYDENSYEMVPATVWSWITETEAEPFLRNLPDESRQLACVVGMNERTYGLLPLEPLRSVAFDCAPDPMAFVDIMAGGLVLGGSFEAALQVFDRVPDRFKQDKSLLIAKASIQTLIATIKGQYDSVLGLVEHCLEHERSGTRKRAVFPDDVHFEIGVLGLLGNNAQEAAKLFESLKKTHKKHRHLPDMQHVYEIASEVTGHGDLSLTMRTRGAFPVLDVILAVSTCWHERLNINATESQYIAWLETVLENANYGQHHWVVAELITVLEQIRVPHNMLSAKTQQLIKQSSGEERHAALGSVSLTKLIQPMVKWEAELRALELLAPVPKQPSAKSTPRATTQKRMIWRVAQLSSFSVIATPIEQSMGKQGQWSQGRKVSLQRLKNNSADFDYLSEQDRKAADSIRKYNNYGWGGGNRYETDQRTAYHLVGHPHVYDDAGNTIEVVEVPAELRMDEEGDTVTVKMHPAPRDHYVASLQAEGRQLEVTHFTAAQRRLFEAMPDTGIAIPLHAKKRLLDVITSLADVIQVQSDAVAITEDTLPGDATPLCELERLESGVAVRFRVEPVPGSGALFDSGVGGEVVFVNLDGSNRAVKRDLEQERDALAAVVDSVAILSAYFDGSRSVVINDLREALALIDELQQQQIRSVWVKGSPLKVKATVSSGQLQIRIKSAAEWFQASGQLVVSEGEAITLSRLLERIRLQPKSRFVELDNNEFIALSESLRQQLEIMAAFQAPRSTRGKKKASDNDESDSVVSLHAMSALSLAPLIDTGSIKGDKHWSTQIARANRVITEDPAIPSTLQADLRSYQVDGFEWMTRLGQLGASVCLADDMGLGKTVQTLAVLLDRAPQGPSLVVAPTSVAGNWMAEAARFAPTLNATLYADAGATRQAVLANPQAFDVVIVSYGLLHSDAEAFTAIDWHTVVLDEAQAIKNASTQRAKAARGLNAAMRIATTGTPIQNNLMDLHSLFDFLMPGLLGSQANFRKQFAVPIARDHDNLARQQLQTLTAPFILRRLKRDVLKDLPSRTEINLSVELSTEEAALYETMRLEALESLRQDDDLIDITESTGKEINAGQRKIEILAQLTRLRRMCCNPTLVENGWTGPQSKLALFTTTLTELLASRHKVLVFSQFVDHLKIIEAELQKQSVVYQYLDGSTPAKQRQQRVNAFQAGEGDVFLISLTAGGTGLNLTAADYVIHLDPWWNPAVEDQASDRAHRIGQKRPVTIYRMVTHGTIEAQIQELHGNKRDLAQSILSGTGSAQVDPDRLLELLRHPIASEY